MSLQMDQWQKVGDMQCARAHTDPTKSVDGDASAYDERERHSVAKP